MRGPRNQSGVSFVDILLIVGLVGVLGAMAIVQMRESVLSYRLTLQADELAAELHAARSIAVARGTVVVVAISQSNGSLGLFDSADPSTPVRYLKFLADGVSFGTVPATPITFSSRGTASVGTFTLTGESGSIAIQVDSSGKTTVGPLVVHRTTTR